MVEGVAERVAATGVQSQRFARLASRKKNGPRRRRDPDGARRACCARAPTRDHGARPRKRTPMATLACKISWLCLRRSIRGIAGSLRVVQTSRVARNDVRRAALRCGGLRPRCSLPQRRPTARHRRPSRPWSTPRCRGRRASAPSNAPSPCPCRSSPRRTASRSSSATPSHHRAASRSPSGPARSPRIGRRLRPRAAASASPRRCTPRPRASPARWPTTAPAAGRRRSPARRRTRPSRPAWKASWFGKRPAWKALWF